MSDQASASDVVGEFVHAIAWGEHRTVWELLSRDGRKGVLRVALGRGMDDVLASRLRDDRAEPEELDAFLTDLVIGLRADLAGTDLDTVVLEPVGDVVGETTELVVATPTPADVARLGIESLPVATVLLVRQDGAWRVDHVAPRLAR